MASFWRRFSIRKPYQFYGRDCAIEALCEILKASGFKKPLFENKREFVVSTILLEQSIYKQASTAVTLYYEEPDGTERYWLGNGRNTSPSDEFIRTIGHKDPMFLLIQIDIAPIYEELRCFLQPKPEWQQQQQATLESIPNYEGPPAAPETAAEIERILAEIRGKKK
jgi:hypothetical protein